MSLCSFVLKLSITIRTRGSIIELLSCWISTSHITLVTTVTSLSSTLCTSCCSHGLSELFRLGFPFLHSCALYLFTSMGIFVWLNLFLFFGSYYMLLLFAWHNSMCLTIKWLSFLNKYFFTHFNMFTISFIIESSTAIRTFRKTHIYWLLKCILMWIYVIIFCFRSWNRNLLLFKWVTTLRYVTQLRFLLLTRGRFISWIIIPSLGFILILLLLYSFHWLSRLYFLTMLRSLSWASPVIF